MSSMLKGAAGVQMCSEPSRKGRSVMLPACFRRGECQRCRVRASKKRDASLHGA